VRPDTFRPSVAALTANDVVNAGDVVGLLRKALRGLPRRPWNKYFAQIVVSGAS